MGFNEFRNAWSSSAALFILFPAAAGTVEQIQYLKVLLLPMCLRWEKASQGKAAFFAVFAWRKRIKLPGMIFSEKGVGAASNTGINVESVFST
ncbi:hypothetical protein [Candidatus Contubernalis alkalaceticus]|nr:hypothetical protein [Candidatus Contubernalis alkalaceticus]